MDYIPWLRKQLEAEAEKHLTIQSSRVAMDAFTSFRESAKYTNLVEDDTSYFGIVQQILEVDYGAFTEVVFYCYLVRVEDKTNGSYVEADTNLRFFNFEKFMRSSKEVDEPFIHAFQATQVFYCADETREYWHLVLESPIRSTPNVTAYEDPYSFTASANEASLISTFVADDEQVGADQV
ncbi:hypothetical protein MKX01_014096 [Papaver californicum]|nr:hypothetical protein MKX01_014096 [Papaver californicum]